MLFQPVKIADILHFNDNAVSNDNSVYNSGQFP